MCDILSYYYHYQQSRWKDSTHTHKQQQAVSSNSAQKIDGTEIN
jgi:hypothetical protein